MYSISSVRLLSMSESILQHNWPRLPSQVQHLNILNTHNQKNVPISIVIIFILLGKNKGRNSAAIRYFELPHNLGFSFTLALYDFLKYSR